MNEKSLPSQGPQAKTKAVIPVYMQGVPARIQAILEVARERGIKVVEDCCQCIGGEYGGRMCGAWGDAGAWQSFPGFVHLRGLVLRFCNAGADASYLFGRGSPGVAGMGGHSNVTEQCDIQFAISELLGKRL